MKRFAGRVIGLAWLLAACAEQPVAVRTTATSPGAVPASLVDPHTFSGNILGPDGSSICNYLLSGSSVLVRVIDPVNATSAILFAGQQNLVCPSNSFAIALDPGSYRLRIQLPGAVGTLPWRWLDPLPLLIQSQDVSRDVQVDNGIVVPGSTSVDGQPVPGLSFSFDYPFTSSVIFGAATAISGPDGAWQENSPARSQLVIQGGGQYLIRGTPCWLLGARLLQTPPVAPFVFPDEVDRIDCAGTDQISLFTHESTRLNLSPFPGDLGGQWSPEFVASLGRGWGAQFPVTPTEPRRRLPGSSELFNGGLLLGLAQDRVLSGYNRLYQGCSSACRDLGLDGKLKTVKESNGGKKVVWVYTDASSAQKVGLRVIQRSYDGQPGSDYVLFRFSIKNTSRSKVVFFAGLYTDWDLGDDILDDVVSTDLAGRLMYTTNAGAVGTHTGTLMSGNIPISGTYASALDPSLTTAEQYQALSGDISQPYLGGTSDKVAYHAVGPITLPAKKTVDLWMAVLAGDDLTQLLSTASVATADMNTRAAKIGDDDEDESGAKPFTASLSSKEPRVEKPYHVNRQPGADEH